MNQLRRPDKPKTAFEITWAKFTYALEGAFFWVEDCKRPVLATVSATVLGAVAFTGVMNQHAIDKDSAALQRAANEDSIRVKSIASGIRGGAVLADISIGDCEVHDSVITVGYKNGVLEIDDYTVPTTVMTSSGETGPQAIHIRNASDLRNISPFAVVCE